MNIVLRIFQRSIEGLAAKITRTIPKPKGREDASPSATRPSLYELRMRNPPR
ncbi:hypothetical protein PGTUg99_020179 [Puccinia graminis f. sp. tritici]|uniref:Uncharacterized protein n=1 Tax=Puccinia graminis f. sp. tritici TaxID=56615 RepID=A0A5B0LW01_PUCGR|nr:hypothetical protein PGTUg99_033557 [Puccinia graminis f. sp. tritici]KAA1075514.1 hypothetical protein PGTUg99_020179 [Puccinia graminis f. sp. tritici]